MQIRPIDDGKCEAFCLLAKNPRPSQTPRKMRTVANLTNCLWASLLSATLLLFMSGCTSPRIERALEDRPKGTGYKVENLFSVGRLPADLRRVAVLPVYADDKDGVERERFNELMVGELRQMGRFEVAEMDRSFLWDLIGSEQVSLTEPIPTELVEYLRAKGFDGIFQLEVNEYRPYRSFVVGVNARLFSLDNQTILWAVDELFRSSEKEIINSARRYALAKQSKRYPNSDSYAVLRGPLLFSEFVMHTIIQTLPPASAP
jgi:hypothetical protein